MFCLRYFFSLYINDVEMILRATGHRGVRVGSTEIYCLVYADDMVIFLKIHLFCKICWMLWLIIAKPGT